MCIKPCTDWYALLANEQHSPQQRSWPLRSFHYVIEAKERQSRSTRHESLGLAILRVEIAAFAVEKSISWCGAFQYNDQGRQAHRRNSP